MVALFAEKYPDVVENVIMIGSGPLEDKYVSEISSRRFQHLSDEDGVIFRRLIDHQATDEDMAKIPQMLDKSDNYCLENREKHKADRADSEMHNKVWREAAKLRTSGDLLNCFARIKSRLHLIQGEFDPHPIKGVMIPLQENGVSCEIHILKKCGHSPFMEKYAKDELYNTLTQIIT